MQHFQRDHSASFLREKRDSSTCSFKMTLPNKLVSFSLSFLLILPLHSHFSAALESEVEDESSFTYIENTGKGPKKWGHINPHWKACDNGKLQSPIDIHNARVQVYSDLGTLKRDYKPARAVINNRGHDIEVRWKGDAGNLNINGTKYDLAQCHWHSPAEHTFNGTRHALELHMVHLTPDTKQIAVIGIVYKFGRPDTFLARLLRRVKSLSGHEEKDVGVINPGDIKFGSRKYYRYIGSLTVPPCTEGVTWTILNKVRTVSREQVHALRNAVHDGFETNARPTQNSNGRSVRFYTPKEIGIGGNSES